MWRYVYPYREWIVYIYFGTAILVFQNIWLGNFLANTFSDFLAMMLKRNKFATTFEVAQEVLILFMLHRII